MDELYNYLHAQFLLYICSNETQAEEHTDHTVEENTYTHFSTIALAARDGSTRWHHLPGEFGEEETKKEVKGEVKLRRCTSQDCLMQYE